MKIRDAVGEFANNLSDQDDRPPPMVRSTTDAEATSAVESVAEDAPYENLPVLSKEESPRLARRTSRPMRGWPQSNR
jgi:hypothetical protein